MADLYKIFKHYWSLREQGTITGAEGDLYMYLVNTSNKLNWKNPFNQSNRLICALLDISEKSLIKYRNNLKQLGLIDFESGKAIKQNTNYWINYRGLDSSSGSGSGSGLDSSSGSGLVLNRSDNIKQIQQDNTKQKNISADKSSPDKKKSRKKDNPEETTPYWPELVKTWFDFNKKKFSAAPSFAGADPRHLKNILSILEKRATNAGVEWKPENAVERFAGFLEKAYEDEWLSHNFLLTNLEKFLDKIILNQSKNVKNGNTNYRKGDFKHLPEKIDYSDFFAGN